MSASSGEWREIRASSLVTRHSSLSWSSGLIRGARPCPASNREPPRQVVKDPPHAPFVQAGPGGDLADAEVLRPEAYDLAMRRGTSTQDAFPKLTTLSNFTGPGLGRGGEADRTGIGQGSLLV